MKSIFTGVVLLMLPLWMQAQAASHEFIAEPVAASGSIKAFVAANPSGESLLVQLEGNTMELQLNLSEVTGKPIANTTIPANQSKATIALKELHHTGYILSLRSAVEKHYATFNLQKVR